MSKARNDTIQKSCTVCYKSDNRLPIEGLKLCVLDQEKHTDLTDYQCVQSDIINQ